MSAPPSPGGRGLQRAFDYLTRPRSRPTIGQRYYDGRLDRDGAAAREARIAARLRQLQQKKQKALERQLRAQLDVGRRLLRIGAEGGWAPRAEAQAAVERAGVFRVFRAAEWEWHLSLALPERGGCGGVVAHYAVLAGRNYPHRGVRVAVLWPRELFRSPRPQLPARFAERYTPDMGLHWVAQLLHRDAPAHLLPGADAGPLREASLAHACPRCGCRAADFHAQLLARRAAYRYHRDPAVERALGVSFGE